MRTPAVEINVVSSESGELAPAASGPAGGDDQQAGGVAAECVGLFGDAEDFGGCRPDAFTPSVVMVPSGAAPQRNRMWQRRTLR
jgi:hypothetical protein